MKLFEAIPSELFSILASPNRHLYGLARKAKYLRNLEEMLQNGEHRLFEEAIREILNCGKTIEQEVFLNDH